MSRSHIVQFLNQQLLQIRTTNLHFPKILLNPDEKERFIRILEENKGSMKNVLNDEWSDKEQKNIALSLWTGCLCAAKKCRLTSVSKNNRDGTPKRESS